MRTSVILLALVVATGAWAQNGPAPGPGQGPAPVQLTADEQKIVDADLKAFNEQAQGWDKERKSLDEQRQTLLDQDKPARGELEKILVAQNALALKRELARFDLEMKWRAAFGTEKARALMGRVMGNPQGPGQGPQGPQNNPPPKP